MHDDAQHGESRAAKFYLKSLSRLAVPLLPKPAERDLRMTKAKQKIPGCFRAEKYAKAYSRISSYLQTMKYKGVSPLVAVYGHSWKNRVIGATLVCRFRSPLLAAQQLIGVSSYNGACL